MDDDMEDEIIYQFFTVHLHLVWKFVSRTSSSIVDMVIPGPGESFKSKFFQPGPFMTITLFVIVSSLILQSRNNWLQQLILSLHRCMTFNVVTDNSIKKFVTATINSTSGIENVTEDLVEGAAGVYALQGRRGNMEDRFSVMQQVDVGGQKIISLFGVYDGHGGQYVAEYVKENLFANTIEKIRQLRSTNNITKNGKKKNSSNDISKRRINGSLSTVILEDSPSSGDEIPSKSKEINKEPVQLEKLPVPVTVISDTNGCKVEELTDLSRSKNSSPLSFDDIPEGESMKKEDPYSNFNLKKKDSLKKSKKILSEKEKLVEPDDSIYIDSNLNINYSKLLTDQILEIDKKIVDHCKSNIDLSGTTAVIAVLDGEHLIIGNVGDSRAVMGDLNGSTIPLSFDHKPNQLKEMKRIKEAGGFITFTGVWRVAGILATSRALGDFPLKFPRKLITAEPDVLTFSLKDHKAHFVVLATDGLWDVMSNEDVVVFIRSHIEERDFGAKSLVMHAYNKGSMDNITVTVLNISKLEL